MSTKLTLPLLDQINVASPCSADWGEMSGDDRKRFCQQCSLHVYDLSTMTRMEAEGFLQSELGTGKRVCVRLYRRTDGRVLTKDCPVGLRRLRLRFVRSIATLFAFFLGGLATALAGTRLGDWAEDQNQIIGQLVCPTTGSAISAAMMGDIGLTPPIPQPPAGSVCEPYSASSSR